MTYFDKKIKDSVVITESVNTENVLFEGVTQITTNDMGQKAIGLVKSVLDKFKGLHLINNGNVYKYTTKNGRIAYAIPVDLNMTSDLSINYDFNKTYPEVNAFFVKNKILYVSILDPDTHERDTNSQMSFNA